MIVANIPVFNIFAQTCISIIFCPIISCRGIFQQRRLECGFENQVSLGFASHRWFLEHWNSQKSVCNVQQRFSWLLDEWIEKICKNIIFHSGFSFKSTLSFSRCTWTGWINLKIFLGYHINYLSIWPFMCHPWFPTRKASKLTFVCFQHQVLNTMEGLDKWSWKQRNVSFEASLVRNQGYT